MDLFEDLEPKGEGREEEGVACHLFLWLQLREGGVVHQLQQMTIQCHLSGRGEEEREPLTVHE